MSTLCRAKWRWQPRKLSGFCHIHFSALQKCRVKNGRNISDNQKYFGNISEKRPFSEKISDYVFGLAGGWVKAGLPAVAPKAFGAKAGQKCRQTQRTPNPSLSQCVAVSRSDKMVKKADRCRPFFASLALCDSAFSPARGLAQKGSFGFIVTVRCSNPVKAGLPAVAPKAFGAKAGQTDMMSLFEVGAGEGNRTLMAIPPL